MVLLNDINDLRSTISGGRYFQTGRDAG